MDVFDKVGERVELFAGSAGAAQPRGHGLHLAAVRALWAHERASYEGGDLMALQSASGGEAQAPRQLRGGGAGAGGDDRNGIETGFGDEWLRFGATSEHTVDGSFSERTMALSVPYPGRRDGYQGNIIESQSVLNAWVRAGARAGIQPNCHANGDVAIDMVLTAYERALKLFRRRTCVRRSPTAR